MTAKCVDATTLRPAPRTVRCSKLFITHPVSMFWLSHILVYLFYVCPSFCPSWDRSIVNKQSYG